MKKDAIFLTGATGVLGSRLIYEILQSSSPEILYCLVRDKDINKGRQRIINAVRIYDTQNRLKSLDLSRIIPISGDVTKKNLSITTLDFNRLVSDISQVVHIAANTSFVSLYLPIKKVNVTGAAHIADFCVKANVPLLYTSSLSVVGIKGFEKDIIYKETDYDIGQKFGVFFYPRSKFEAEGIVREASKKQGLRYTIVRPGSIWGDSETGAYPLSSTSIAGLNYNFLKTITDTGTAIFRKDSLDMVPVDYVARAMLAVIQDLHFNNKTYHLTSLSPILIYELLNYMVEFGYSVRFFPYEEYIDLFKKERVILNETPYRSEFIKMSILFKNYFMESKVKVEFDMTQANRYLKKKGIKCPEIDLDLIAKYLQYCINQKFIVSPERQIPAKII